MSFMKMGKIAAASVLSAVLAVSVLSPAQATGNLDSDGDKLPDVWELKGYDANNDGIIDLDFPAWGASPYKKDIFVEMDWMPGLLGAEEDLDRIVKEFAQLPVRNPDGTTGINIHLDAGSARSADYNLGGGNEVPYSELKDSMRELGTYRTTYSQSARNGIFHYMIWADKYGNNGSSGVAHMNGLNFLVTVGPTYWRQASSNVKVGTFIHELGHNLGIGHGGNDSFNYKPNYLSVMNYSYQLGGIPYQGGNRFMYSTRSFPSLDENALDEKRGFGASTLGYLFNRAPMHRNVDFNRNGVIDNEPVAMDLNRDNVRTVLHAPNDLVLLKFQPRVVVTAPGLGADENAEATFEVEHDHDHEDDWHENELTAEIARELKMIP